MKKIKKVWQMLQYNLKSLMAFEFFFKILSVLLFTPLFLHCFNLIMKMTGYKYLTLENISSFFLNPLVLILLVILILSMMVYTMFDITTIIIILDQSYHFQKIKTFDAIRIALEKCKNMFHYKNLSLAILILFLIPFLNIGISSSFITTIKIPEYIFDYILQNKILFCLLIIVFSLLVLLLLNWIYSIHYYVLEVSTFKEAKNRSKNLSKKNYLKDLITLLLIQILFFLVYLTFVILGIFIIFIFNKLFANILILKSLLTTIVWVHIAVSFLGFTLLSTPISYAGISILYYEHKIKKKEKIKIHYITQNKRKEKRNSFLKKSVIAVSIVAFLVATDFTYGIYTRKYSLYIDQVRDFEITAHRGASLSFPENTMSAFEGAKDLGANWIELDVQQTKDGYLVVSHDSNLKKTAGMNKKIMDLTLEELKDIDVGSFFDEQFKGEHIPTLDYVINWAKENNIKLNIEIKPTKKEQEVVKKVVDTIEASAFLPNCVISSSSYDILKKVKEYKKEIETVYVLSIAYGDILVFDQADHFSIEATSITKKLVNNIHKEGKRIYAWTLNTEENLQKMIDYNVDNIITDDVALAKEVIYKNKTSDLISEYIKWIEKLF